MLLYEDWFVSLLLFYLDTLPDLQLLSQVSQKHRRHVVLQSTRIDRVAVRGLPAISDAQMRFLAHFAGHLLSLQLENCGFSGMKFIQGIQWKSIGKIVIKQCPNIQDQAVANLVQMHRKSIVELRWKFEGEKVYAQAVLTKCFGTRAMIEQNRLENIKVVDCPTIFYGEEFCSLAFLRYSPLRILNLTFVKMNTEDFILLAPALQGIEQLSIKLVLHHSHRQAKFDFPRCPKLWKLELVECQFKHAAIAFDLPNLKILNLRSANIDVVLGSFPKLEHLDLSWTMLPSISIANLIQSSNCTGLKIGQFDGSLIDEDCLQVLESIAKSAKLYVHSCRSIPIHVRKKVRTS
jgi:hypothetical protein